MLIFPFAMNWVHGLRAAQKTVGDLFILGVEQGDIRVTLSSHQSAIVLGSVLGQLALGRAVEASS